MVVVEALIKMGEDPSVRCLTITGTGTKDAPDRIFYYDYWKKRQHLRNGSYKYSSDPNRERSSEGNGHR